LRILIVTGAALAAAALAANATAQTKAAPKPAAPANAAVPVPRATFIATMDAEFRKIDADHNNILTKEEAKAFEQAVVANVIENRRRALFAALDADHNGQINAQEFARLELPTPQVSTAPLFTQNDLNKDGQISLVEYRTGKLANFDRMDADKDGVVSPAEMKAAGLIK